MYEDHQKLKDFGRTIAALEVRMYTALGNVPYIALYITFVACINIEFAAAEEDKPC